MSTATSSIPNTPCTAGLFTSAPECAIGAVPHPASFETIPRVTPTDTTLDSVKPNIPPPAANMSAAPAKIFPKTIPRSGILPNIIYNDIKIYNPHTAGISFAEISAILFNPPRMTARTGRATITPHTTVGSPVSLVSADAAASACTALPIERDVARHSAANSPAEKPDHFRRVSVI